MLFPVCILTTGDRADGGGEINSLKSVQKCLIASKSAEHVQCARHTSKHSSNVVQTANRREGKGFRVIFVIGHKKKTFLLTLESDIRTNVLLLSLADRRCIIRK